MKKTSGSQAKALQEIGGASFGAEIHRLPLMCGEVLEFQLLCRETDAEAPLVYVWQIWTSSGKLFGAYVGRSKHGALRPFHDYYKRLDQILSNRPYSKKSPDGFRKVHRRLKAAVLAGYVIRLTLLGNAHEKDLPKLERHYIGIYDCQGDRPHQLNEKRKRLSQ